MPAKKPRTECCCQPVAFMIAAIVTPSGCPSRLSTAACLVPPRAERERVFLPFTGFFARLLGWASLVLLAGLLCDILASLSVATASGAVTTQAPQWRHRQRDGDPNGPSGPYHHGDTDAPFAVEVQSFLH